jgi:hypothetical protein
MRRVQIVGVAFLLAASTRAWAGVEPYPAAVQAQPVSTMTRAQVIAELHEAQRLGLIVNGEGDFPVMTPLQIQMVANAGSQAADPGQVAQASALANPEDAVVVWGDPRVLRAKIRAETIEANRLGLIGVGEGNPPVATAAQEELIASAGRRAAEAMLVAHR